MTELPEHVKQAALKALETLRAINEKYGREGSSHEPHVKADAALIQFFVDVGLQEIADEFDSVEPRWYE